MFPMTPPIQHARTLLYSVLSMRKRPTTYNLTKAESTPSVRKENLNQTLNLSIILTTRKRHHMMMMTMMVPMQLKMEE